MHFTCQDRRHDTRRGVDIQQLCFETFFFEQFEVLGDPKRRAGRDQSGIAEIDRVELRGVQNLETFDDEYDKANIRRKHLARRHNV